MIVLKRNMVAEEAIKTANDNIDEYLPLSVEEIVIIGVLGALAWTVGGETILSEYENSSEVYRKSNSWDKFHPYGRKNERSK